MFTNGELPVLRLIVLVAFCVTFLILSPVLPMKTSRHQQSRSFVGLVVSLSFLLLATLAFAGVVEDADTEVNKVTIAMQDRSPNNFPTSVRRAREVEYHGVEDTDSSSSTSTRERPADYYEYYEYTTPSPTGTPRPRPPSTNSSSSSTETHSTNTSSSSHSYEDYDSSSSSSGDDEDDHTGLWVSIGMFGAAVLAGIGFVILLVLGAASRL
jgi:hypothetical protein